MEDAYYETEHDRTVAEVDARLARMGLMDDGAGLNALQRAEKAARRSAQREAGRAAATAEAITEPAEQRVCCQINDCSHLPLPRQPRLFSLNERVYQEERERKRRRHFGGRNLRSSNKRSWFN